MICSILALVFSMNIFHTTYDLHTFIISSLVNLFGFFFLISNLRVLVYLIFPHQKQFHIFIFMLLEFRYNFFEMKGSKLHIEFRKNLHNGISYFVWGICLFFSNSFLIIPNELFFNFYFYFEIATDCRDEVSTEPSVTPRSCF